MSAAASGGAGERLLQDRAHDNFPIRSDPMDNTCIVTANAGRARFFSQERPNARLEEVSDMVNPAARLRTAETETDELGQRAASKSRHSVGAPTQPSGYEPNQSPAEHQTEIFARSIGDYLLDAHQQGRYTRLVLAASPEFLGVLRKLLDPKVRSAISLEINKDYTQLAPDKLREQIEANKA
jgi:protein required for attachment to host cells